MKSCITFQKVAAPPKSTLLRLVNSPSHAFIPMNGCSPINFPSSIAGIALAFAKKPAVMGGRLGECFEFISLRKLNSLYSVSRRTVGNILMRLAVSEDFYQSLGLPYRVVSIVSGKCCPLGHRSIHMMNNSSLQITYVLSGALNNAAAKKYDLEAYLANLSAYRELVSCSNCTSYQTRGLNIRYGFKKEKGATAERKDYVHALNAVGPALYIYLV